MNGSNRNKLQQSNGGENGWKMVFSRSENTFPTLESDLQTVSKLLSNVEIRAYKLNLQNTLQENHKL
jgi:hypothetical protein